MEHKSVLLEEAIEYLNIKPDGIYVDATLGGGGHSSEILRRLKTGKLIAFDQDDFAIDIAKKKLDQISNNYMIIKSNFVNVKEELAKVGIEKIDGILYDLGVSSFQFDIKERGFSYREDAPLDMRMDLSNSLTAKRIVNEYAYDEIVKILYRYGEEEFAKQIARRIEKERENKMIETTFQLVEIIKKSLPQKVLNQKGHPAKKTFQALRIAVNDELQVFEKSLIKILDILNPQARVVVITFHSLEDRICKSIFKDESTVFYPKGLPIIEDKKANLTLITRKPVLPSAEELENNNRAHSAHMRVAEKN